MRSDLRRNLGLGGLFFVVLFVVSTFIVPMVNSDASAAKAVEKYSSHQGALAVQGWLIGVAIVVGIAYFWYLRELLAETQGVRRLATIGFAGALIFAASGAVSAGIAFALSDISGKAGFATTVQTLNVFNDDVSGVMAAGGVAAFLLGTGIAVTRSAALPGWLGWVAVVLGVASLAVPFFSPPAAALWVLIASIVMLATRAPAPASEAAAAA